MSRLRIERWSNAHRMASAHHGGQAIDYFTTLATKWTVSFSHPDIGECFCVQSFDSLLERTEFIKEVLENEND